MRRGSLSQPRDPSYQRQPGSDLQGDWTDWVASESLRRTAFFAFIMDAQHASIFGHTPALSVNDVRLPLPCPEDIWSCADFSLAMNRLSDPDSHIEFLTVLKRVVNRVPLPAHCSPYARTVVLHGLFSVAEHLKARELATLGLGAAEARRLAVDMDSAASRPEEWREILSQAITVSSFSHPAGSQHNNLCLQPLPTLHRMAHLSINVNIVDIHVSARAPSLLGHMLMPADIAKADNRVQRWAHSPGARRAFRHALQLVQETILTAERYKASEDNIAIRPWCLYHATLICWAYSTRASSAAGRTEGPIMSAEEYVVRALASVEPDGPPFDGLQRIRGLLGVVRDSLRSCRWELLEEAHHTLDRLAQTSPG